MKKLKKEEVLPLKESIEKLLEFLYDLNLKKVPYFMKFLERMNFNLRTCILVDYDGWEQLEDLLKRDWNEANHAITGIPAFRLPMNDPDEKKRLEKEFFLLLTVVDVYVNH